MKYGFVFPKADVFHAIDFAKLAEETNWDAFFVWEPTYGINAWMTLTAFAVETKKIRSMNSPFDIIIEGKTPRDDPDTAKSIIKPFADAGATWRIESNWIETDLNQIKARVKEGPPLL